MEIRWNGRLYSVQLMESEFEKKYKYIYPLFTLFEIKIYAITPVIVESRAFLFAVYSNIYVSQFSSPKQ